MSLNIDRVTKLYKNNIAVDKISLTLEPGIYGLLGENGAGKTTLMRIICGILRPSSGTITYDGLDVNDEDYRALLGYLPQEFGYYPNFTAVDFMYYMSSLKGLSKYKAKEKTHELLELVSLTGVAKKKIKTFSGGMLRRLGIAQALLNDPKILILDEPTAGLDPKERVRFRNLISRLGNDRIILLSTHIVSDIEHIAHTILLMKDGCIIQQGSYLDVIKTIEKKVYEIHCERTAAKELIDKYTIINIREEGNISYLRVVSDKPPIENSKEKDATLEDLYLYYFREVL